MRGIDDEQLVQVLKEQAPCLRRFLLSRGASADEVDDLVQDTFVVAWEKRKVILDEKARKYLTSVARCILMAHRRKNGTRQRLLGRNHTEVLREVHPKKHCEYPEMLEIVGHRNCYFYSCLNELPATLREVLELVHIEGMTRKQVAEIQGCGLRTVYAREKAAIVRLRLKCSKYD